VICWCPDACAVLDLLLYGPFMGALLLFLCGADECMLLSVPPLYSLLQDLMADDNPDAPPPNIAWTQSQVGFKWRESKVRLLACLCQQHALCCMHLFWLYKKTASHWLCLFSMSCYCPRSIEAMCLEFCVPSCKWTVCNMHMHTPIIRCFDAFQRISAFDHSASSIWIAFLSCFHCIQYLVFSHSFLDSYAFHWSSVRFSLSRSFHFFPFET